jgi:hypothetical protein
MVNKCRTKYVKWGEELDDGVSFHMQPVIHNICVS